MKNLKVIVLSGILVLTMWTAVFAKGGIISATKAGTISATKAGTISATRGGTISATRTGIISTTRTGLISTTRQDTSVGSNQAWLIELLFMIYSP
jgi:hypothetical protein